MAEQESALPSSFPYIDVDDILDRLGIDEMNATHFFPSVASSRTFIGRELTRATGWFKNRTGWNLNADDDLSDPMKYDIAECIYDMVASKFYNRAAIVRIEMASEYRIMARESRQAADDAISILKKTKIYSRVTPYSATSKIGTIGDE